MALLLYILVLVTIYQNNTAIKLYVDMHACIYITSQTSCLHVAQFSLLSSLFTIGLVYLEEHPRLINY